MTIILECVSSGEEKYLGEFEPIEYAMLLRIIAEHGVLWDGEVHHYLKTLYDANQNVVRIKVVCVDE